MPARDAGRDRAINSRIEKSKIDKSKNSKIAKIEIGKNTNLQTGDNFAENERLEKRTTKAKRCKSLLEGQLCADSLAEAR